MSTSSVDAPAAPKSPRRVQAGRESARRRWAGHTAKVVRLDSLSGEQRRLVLALVRAAREEAAASDPAASSAGQ